MSRMSSAMRSARGASRIDSKCYQLSAISGQPSTPVCLKADTTTLPRSAMTSKNEVGIDGPAAPPLTLGAELEDREVQMRRAGRRVARGADVTDHLALFDRVAFVQVVGVTLQVRVVVTEPPTRIELVDRVAAGLADEQLRDGAVL